MIALWVRMSMPFLYCDAYESYVYNPAPRSITLPWPKTRKECGGKKEKLLHDEDRNEYIWISSPEMFPGSLRPPSPSPLWIECLWSLAEDSYEVVPQGEENPRIFPRYPSKLLGFRWGAEIPVRCERFILPRAVEFIKKRGHPRRDSQAQISQKNSLWEARR